MPIKYFLQNNPITPDPNDQSARVLPNDVLDAEGIIKKMLKRGTTLTETDIKAALTLFFDVVTDEVADGNNVNLPLVNVRPSISGVFTTITDSFDASRHNKKATLSMGVMLYDKMQKATPEKITQPIPTPVVLEYLDVNTNTVNSVLTSGGIGQVVGEELKFDPTNADEGIFFIPQAGAEVKVSVIATRTEGKLMFSIPAGLAAGSYTLEVRRAYTKNNTIRKGVLNDTLTVA